MRRLLSSLLLMMKLFATGPTAFESVAATAWVNDRVVRWLGQTVAGLTDTDPVLVVPTGVVLAGGTWVGQRHSATTDLARGCHALRVPSACTGALSPPRRCPPGRSPRRGCSTPLTSWCTRRNRGRGCCNDACKHPQPSSQQDLMRIQMADPRKHVALTRGCRAPERVTSPASRCTACVARRAKRPVSNDIAAILRRMQPRRQRYRGSLPRRPRTRPPQRAAIG